AKQEPLTSEPQANLPQPSAKPLDMLSSVPLEFPTSGNVGATSDFPSLIDPSEGTAIEMPLTPELEPALAQASESTVPDTPASIPVPTSPPITPSLSVLIQEADEEDITPI